MKGERGRREKNSNVRETHWLIVSPTGHDRGWGFSLQPRYVPFIGIKPRTFQSESWRSLHWAKQARGSEKNLIANGHRRKDGENYQENHGCYTLAPEVCKQRQGVCKDSKRNVSLNLGLETLTYDLWRKTVLEKSCYRMGWDRLKRPSS